MVYGDCAFNLNTIRLPMRGSLQMFAKPNTGINTREMTTVTLCTLPTMQATRLGFNPWVGKIPWRRKWQSTPVCLPGECHGRRSLAGLSPKGHTESGTLALDANRQIYYNLGQYCPEESPDDGNVPYRSCPVWQPLATCDY